MKFRRIAAASGSITCRAIGPSPWRAIQTIVRSSVRSRASGRTNTMPYVVVRRNVALARTFTPAQDVTDIRTRGPANRRMRLSRAPSPLTA